MYNYYLFSDGPLGNWFTCKLKYLGHEFKSSEQLFMWLKSIHFGDMDTANEILVAPNPKVAKQLGRRVRNFNESNWEKVRQKYMTLALIIKYTYCPEFRFILNKSLDSQKFVECTKFDKIWGCGLTASEVANGLKFTGLNLLGNCIDRVRSYYRNPNRS